jgi:hypothetical protein
VTTKLELRQAIIEDTHRPDLASQIDRFIRLGEGMIRRDLTAYELSYQLTDADRLIADQPEYNLPARVLIPRRLQTTNTVPALSKVAVDIINAYPLTDPPHSYTIFGNTLSIRGNPAEGSTLTLDYYGTPPPLSADDDTNELLNDHETLYQAGATFFLYQHTQDRELAADQLDIFNGVMATLNESYARKLGGQKVSEAYNFAGGSSY